MTEDSETQLAIREPPDPFKQNIVGQGRSFPPLGVWAAFLFLSLVLVDDSVNSMSASAIARPDYRLVFPMVKAVADVANPEFGAIRVHGVFTDEKPDLDRHFVHAGDNPDAFNYGFKKYNWNHGKKLVGDVNQVGFMSAERARRDFGHLKDIQWQGTVGFNRGLVHELTPEAMHDPAFSDLRECRHYVKNHIAAPNEVNIGFSLEGKGGLRKSQHTGYYDATPSWVPLIAICNQPKNDSSFCTIVKSLEDFCKALDFENAWDEVLDAPEPEARPQAEQRERIVIWNAPAGDTDLAAGIIKAMDSGTLNVETGTKAAGGATGGLALQTEDLSAGATVHGGKTVRKECRSCSKCQGEVLAEQKFCPACGQEYLSTRELIKALNRVSSRVPNLLN